MSEVNLKKRNSMVTNTNPNQNQNDNQKENTTGKLNKDNGKYLKQIYIKIKPIK